MIKIKEAIVVEGIYDKVKLANIFDTVIVPTGGFDIFKNRNTQMIIQKLARSRGIIVFTDCDRAGFVIRNFIKNIVKSGVVKHAYIPEIEGKEKRKSAPSKEGFLGVEGVGDDIIKSAIEKCGVSENDKHKRLVTKADLFADGLERRRKPVLNIEKCSQRNLICLTEFRQICFWMLSTVYMIMTNINRRLS